MTNLWHFSLNLRLKALFSGYFSEKLCHAEAMDTKSKSVRLDKWLWAARFYKTRQIAIKALKNGKISLNKQVCKPATNINSGDHLIIKSGLFETEIRVLNLSEKRGSAKVAQMLYEETTSSISKRHALKEQLAQQPKIDIARRKPDKRGVRSHRALKRGSE